MISVSSVPGEVDEFGSGPERPGVCGYAEPRVEVKFARMLDRRWRWWELA